MLVEAVERTLALVGGLESASAEVEAVRMLAAELDLAPGDTDLWREYRLALKALREVLGSNDAESSEDLDSEFAALGRSGVRDVEESGPAD